MSMTTVTPDSVADRLGVGDVRIRFGHLVRWLLSGVIVLAVATAAVFMWNQREETAAVQYITQPVTRGDLRVTVTATGNLAPTNQVQVGSELREGKVVRHGTAAVRA